MEQILNSELQAKSAISIGVFDIIEQLDDGMVIIKSDERTKLKETPPRAWGRLQSIPDLGVPEGNTPTGVGKTR